MGNAGRPYGSEAPPPHHLLRKVRGARSIAATAAVIDPHVLGRLLDAVLSFEGSLSVLPEWFTGMHRSAFQPTNKKRKRLHAN